MSGRATPPAEHAHDTPPPVRRELQAGGGEPITNGDELLEALTVAVRRAGFKELEDLLAGRTNTRYERIREELANVCQAVGPDLETAARTVAERRELAAITTPIPFAEWAEHNGPALWWCFPIEEPPYAGTPMDDDFPPYMTHWTPIVVPTRPPTNLERITASAAVNSVQSGSEFGEAFARAAKGETP